MTVTLARLDRNPHPVLAHLRRSEPVSWLPALGGWIVTRRDVALRVLRDSVTFTVDDPRFTTARVIGPSMLSLDGPAHARHRGPFARDFSRDALRSRMAAFTEAEAGRLVDALRPAGTADLRRDLAGPLAVAVIGQVLGLAGTEPAVLLVWYEAIVGAVSALAGPPSGVAVPAHAGVVPGLAGSAGAEALGNLRAHLRAAVRDGSGTLLAAASAAGTLTEEEVVSNAAVLMFGGIETTEGMIANALLHLLGNPGQLALVRADPDLLPGAVEESLRLEPAAALVDRYATEDVRLGGAHIRRGDPVSVSLAGAGRDPAVFGQPDRFDVRRGDARKHLAFAHGPHFCIGAHLARLEAQAAVRAALRLPGLRLDPASPAAPRGLVFRKPPSLPVHWDT